MSKPFTASNRQLYSWGTGAIADAFMITAFGLVMPIFTTGFGISAIAVSWAVTLPRFIDSLLDPVVAHWSDNSKTRWGRRKPFMLVSSLLGAAVLAGIWWADPAWSATTHFVFLLVMATILYCAFGTYAMAHTALGYELTDDYHERTRVVAIRGLFVSVVAVVNGWVYWLALRPKFGGEIHGMRFIGAVIALLVIGAAMVTILTNRERFHQQTRPHVKIIPALQATFRNRPFVILICLRIVQSLGTSIFWGLWFFLNTFHVCNGDKAMAMKIGGILAATGTVLNFAMFPLMRPISRLIGKRNGVIIGAGLTAAAGLSMPLIMQPQHPYLQVIAWCIIGPATGIAQTLVNAIFPDICDIDELHNMHRREGLFGAVVGFISKIELSLCALAVGYLVAWSGIDPTGIEQSHSARVRLQWFAHLPNILCSLAAVAIALRFPITEQHMIEVRKQLEARRAKEVML